MADAGSAVAPAALTQVRCPRCKFPRTFTPAGPLLWRCTGCEWLFTLAAPTVASPAVPASTVTAANTTGSVVAVTVTAGTLTAVTVNGAQAGTTAGVYLVPAGGTIAVTYSVAPTWAWALPKTSAVVSAGGTALPFTAGGTAFTAGQLLIVDPAGTSDVVPVTGTPTGTSVPVAALNAAHGSAVSVAVAQMAPAYTGQAVPQNAY